MSGFWKVFITAFISTVIVGGITFYFMNQKLTADNKDKDAKISDLTKQVADLGGTSTTPTSTSATATTDPTAGWKTYTNTKYGFSIKYPKFDSTGTVSGGGNEEWIAKEISVGGASATTNFGPPSSAQGGYVWGLTVMSGVNTTIEKQIASQGNQFADRKESKQTIQVDGKSATIVTVTTASTPSWISRVVYVEKDGNIIEISNGAIESASFDLFYKTFQFTK